MTDSRTPRAPRPRILAASVMAFVLLTAAQPALAGWKLVPARAPWAVGTVTLVPTGEWNQASARPGKQGVAWTKDGLGLNGLEIFAAVPDGQPLYRERKRKDNPLPRFDRGALLPDLADFFERSFRVANGVTDFRVEEVTPAPFAGQAGIRVRYRYTNPNDELVRLGEARLAVIGGKLYAANFYAPELHYFEATLPEARAIMDGAKIGG